jgi:hypothetical protein
MGTVSSATLTPQPEPAGASTNKQAFLDQLLDERTLQQQQEQQEAQRRQAAYWEELHRSADALLRRRQDEQINGDTGVSEEPAPALPLWRPGPQAAVLSNPLHRPSRAASTGMVVAAGSERGDLLDDLLAAVQPTRVEDDLDALLDGDPPQHAVRDDDLPFDLL